jgi:hypothetical protein
MPKARALQPPPPEVVPYLGRWIAARCGTPYRLSWDHDTKELRLQRRDELPYKHDLADFLRQLRFNSFTRPDNANDYSKAA